MTKPQNLGMRILSLTICLMCLLSLVQPVTVSAVEETASLTMTTVVRGSASSQAVVIGQMENGTVIDVLKSSGSFYQVDCYDMKGYIAKSQIVHSEDGKYYVNCDPKSSETKLLAYTDYAEALTLRHSLLALAKKQLGDPYVRGGERPGGFDCSGLTSYLYRKHDISLHRTASQQLQDGIIVSRDGMQVGDLIFFREGRHYPASHVGIYVGNNQMIHAGSRGIEYKDLDNSYCTNNFLCVRRIINTGAAQMEEVSVARTVNSTPLTFNSVSGRTSR